MNLEIERSDPQYMTHNMAVEMVMPINVATMVMVIFVAVEKVVKSVVVISNKTIDDTVMLKML